MKFAKADPEVVKLFNSFAPGKRQGVEERSMFGYPCRFVNGNMFMGLHNNSMILRLQEADRLDFAKHGATPFEPMPGRVMKEYVVVPSEMLKSQAGLKPWIEKSLDYALKLPPKLKKARKS